MTTRQRTNPVLAQIAAEIDHAARLLEQTNAAIASTPALDTADLWALFRSGDTSAAWSALANLSERQMVIQAAAMAGYLFDAEAKLISAEAILNTWQRRLVERAAAAQVEEAPVPSDLAIPSVDSLLDAAQERGETARIHGDYQGAGQLDRVRANLLRGALLQWHKGDLLIQSVNNPSQTYSVNRRGCTCPNGRKRKQECWHVSAYDLLLDIQEDAAAAADILAEAAAWRDENPEPPAPLGQRIAAARAASAWWRQEAA